MARGRRLSRIKLKPLAPEAAAKYLRDWRANDLRLEPERFPKLTSMDLFGNTRPLEVEIGSGSGEFLVSLAAQRLEANFLGIDVSGRRSLYAAGLAAEASLENILFLRANFRLVAPLIPEGGWHAVYFHFPDPVHKRKDEKRSVYRAGFLDAVATGLVLGGHLSVVSDNPNVFFPLLEEIEGDARFERVHSERYLQGLPDLPKSRFQQVWERRGVIPLRVLVRKVDG